MPRIRPLQAGTLIAFLMLTYIKWDLMVKKSLLCILLFLTKSTVYAQTNQSLELLKNKIEYHVINELSTHAEGRIQVTADKIDSRLQLGPCEENQLEVFNPYQTTMLKTSTMGIRCKEAENHWTLYVPIKIALLKPVYVAKRMLVRGSPIREEDMYQTELDVQLLRHGYFIDKEELIGQICKQNIDPDSPLTPYNIELAKLVHKGEQVSIVASEGNLNISMNGIALSTGALGELIKVKNLSSKRIIETRVLADKKVGVIL